VAQVHANTDPVGFDFAAAERLIAEFSNAAEALRSATAARSTLAGEALAEWRGRFARQFAIDMTACRLDADRLAGTYELAAEQIRVLRDAAEREQHRRDVAREWEQEQVQRSLFQQTVDGVQDFAAGLTHTHSPNRPTLPPEDPPTLPPLPVAVRGRYLNASGVTLDVD
jgi:hypothetical protein